MPYRKPYYCGKCGKLSTKEELTAMIVAFKPLGSGTKTLKSRTAAWLCPTCLGENEYWNIPSHDAPAYQI